MGCGATKPEAAVPAERARNEAAKAGSPPVPQAQESIQVIKPLVSLVQGGTDEQKESAAEALNNLACNDENQVAIAATGGIEPLVALARSGTDEQKKWAATALSNLACNHDNKVAIAAAGFTV